MVQFQLSLWPRTAMGLTWKSVGSSVGRALANVEEPAWEAQLDLAIADVEKNPAPLTALAKVGQPYVNAYLDNDTRAASMRARTALHRSA